MFCTVYTVTLFSADAEAFTCAQRDVDMTTRDVRTKEFVLQVTCGVRDDRRDDRRPAFANR